MPDLPSESRISPAGEPRRPLRSGAVAVGALGVVFGDIGTSPLYAFEQCFPSHHPSTAEVLGVFSLVFWALLLVVCIKYLSLILRADNQGEGGILALIALLQGAGHGATAAPSRLALVGLLGAALLYGDGLITPAISVLSAVEGLEVLAPDLSRLAVPLTVAILLTLFALQSHGTARVAAIFGPAMLVWFTAIGALGGAQLLSRSTVASQVLIAIDPRWGISLLTERGWEALQMLGSLVLVVTGVEALYADLGHFGAKPIRRAWYWFAFPALLLNYAGQAALVLERGYVGEQPFFDLAPRWAAAPLVALATVATVIASQALISGVFSLTEQAVQLGYTPRLRVLHTSDVTRGQVYLPHVNVALAFGCVAMVLAFRSSDALASAYGVAVTGTMAVTSVLFFALVRGRWLWPLAASVPLLVGLLVVDLAFLAGTLGKIPSGGWVPLAIAALLFTVMSTWARGRRELGHALAATAHPLQELLARLAAGGITRVPGTGVYWTLHTVEVPPVLMRNLIANQALHERVVLLSILSAEVPRVRTEERASVVDLGQGLLRVGVLFGFAERPQLRRILEACSSQGLRLDPAECIFFLGRYNLLPSGPAKMASWRKVLFALVNRNGPDPAQSFEIPPERTVEIGLPIAL